MSENPAMDRDAVAAIATLDDDVRRALFGYVRDASGPVTREAAADAVGISRKLAAFHLDKLVDAGLLQARIQAVGPPRVGRMPKVYEPSRRDIAIDIPHREHALLADILLTAAADAKHGEAVLLAARRRGEQEGSAERERVRPGRLGPERAIRLVQQVLARHGYEPVPDGTNCLCLRNCPFHPLVDNAPEIVCGLNHAYLAGVLHGLGADTALDAVLEPANGRCCVAFRPSSQRAADPASTPAP